LRKLHLVGLTTDRDGLIFTARKGSKSGGYIVPLDDEVLAAVAEVQADRNGDGALDEVGLLDVEAVPRRPRHQSALTPREMQARLRAGRSIEEVAAEAGVDNEWVARFAVPILAEQAQVVELARTLVYAKPRLGESSQPLGPSVMQNLSDRGIFLPDDVAERSWSAFQLHDAVWMVRFRYRSRGRAQEAQWEVDVPAGRLHARNRHASDLGYVDAGRRRKLLAVDEEQAEAEPPPARRPPRPTRGAKGATATSARRAPAKVTRTPAAAVRPAPKSANGAKSAVRSAATPAGRPAKVAKVAKAAKAANAAKAAKGAAKPAKSVRTAKAPAAKRPAAAARSVSGRRPAKAAPAPEPGPSTGSGGVRSAVAQVSTARVTASLASAERSPWAAVVRRPSGARLAPANGSQTWEGMPAAHPAPAPERRERNEDTSVPAFEPRPLPAGGDPSVSSRVRKVSVPSAPAPASGGPKPVSLPAPRRPAAAAEPLPAERPKRRRLRPR
jgi:hypothetical protein